MNSSSVIFKIETNTTIDIIQPPSDSIIFYAIVTVMPIGVAFNLISIIIFQRPSFNKNKMGFLYTVLAVLNTASILNYVLVTKGTLVFGYPVFFGVCGMENFIRRSFFNMCSWSEALISLDRFLSIHYPGQGKFCHTKKFHVILFIVLSFIIIGGNSTNLISNTFVSSQTNTTTRCVMSDAMNFTSTVIALFLRIYLPLGAMLFFNGLIIRDLVRSKSKVTNRTRSSKRYLREKRFAGLTVVHGFCFWIFYLPISCYLTANLVNFFNRFVNGSNSALFSFIYDATQTIAVAYHGMIFFENIIFNKIFRREFCLICCKKLSSVSSDVRDPVWWFARITFFIVKIESRTVLISVKKWQVIEKCFSFLKPRYSL